MKIRKNTTISKVILSRAEEIMKLRGFDDFSEFISALVREEHERRQPPILKEGSHGKRGIQSIVISGKKDPGPQDS